MSQVNEFSMNLPLTNASPMGDAPSVIAQPAQALSVVDITAGYDLPDDVDSEQCSHINVWVDNTSVMNYNPKDPIVTFDIVLSVSITDPTDLTCAVTNYKLVKRIAMNKCKLACDAEKSTPVQVVEAEEDQEEVAKIMEGFYAAKRVREIAGISESAGAKTFKIGIKYPNPSGKGMASAEVVVKAVKDAAHARHVFTTKHQVKQYKDAKITRVTEVK